MDKIKGAKQLLKVFDENQKAIRMFAPKKKDFSSLIAFLELLLEQMKLTREVSQQIKQEMPELDENEFVEESEKRILPKLIHLDEQIQKIAEPDFMMMVFALPDNKVRKFLEIMVELEEAAALRLKDPSKKEKIANIIDSMEQLVAEVKEISQPLFIPAEIDPNQTITFKVKLNCRKKIWRKIELKASNSLEDLHDAIQVAFGWDNDHLYSFFMDNDVNSREFDAEYTCPFEPEARHTADEAELGIFGFSKGQKFAYLFDFGDCHSFEVQVVGFGKTQKNKMYPAFVDLKGKAPEQYPEMEEI